MITIKELMSLCYSDVRIWTELKENDFKELYKGSSQAVPSELLDKEVLTIESEDGYLNIGL